jgi:hypothetical protein
VLPDLSKGHEILLHADIARHSRLPVISAYLEHDMSDA